MVEIGDKSIGPGHPVYVIAEIGSNHDGSLDTAKTLIETAAKCGADAAKFQFYRELELYPGQTTPWALPDWWLLELQECAHNCGVEFMASVFSLETLNVYLMIEPAAIKIASPEATDYELLYCAAATGLPVIVSTGACDMVDVNGVRLFLEGTDWVLLHCVSAYPARADEMNLAVLPMLAREYGVPVGLSDHSMERLVAEYAVAAGASVIEKHLTLDRSLPGPDHPFALEPREFRALVKAIRRVERVMGDGVKRVQASEDPLDRRVAVAA